MTVGIYIRVSTEDQVREGFSISAQREKLKAYCIAQDWNDFKFYVDEGISAKNTERPQLQLMIDHIKQGMITTVLVYRLDRLTRSVLDLYKLLETFDRHDCAFKSATEVYDTTTAMGRMFITIVAALAQWERENLGERVRMGQIEKARQGEYGAKAPFGFDKGKDGKLVINKDEESVIRMMIKKLEEGYSIRRLSNYMNDSGIPTIRSHKWHIATILDILHNPALRGAVKWRDEIKEDAHKGILTKEEHQKLEKMLWSRQNFKKRKTYHDFVYQMKLICPNCGNHLTCERGVYTRKRDNAIVHNNHYRCQACVLNKRKAIAISEKKMDTALLKYMSNIKFDIEPEIQEEDDTNNEIEQISNEIKKIERQREKFQKAWSNDLMTDEEFTERMNETRNRYDELTKQLKNTKPKTNKEDIDIEKIKTIANDFKKNWNVMTREVRKNFVNTFIDKIEFKKEEGHAIVTKVRYY